MIGGIGGLETGAIVGCSSGQTSARNHQLI